MRKHLKAFTAFNIIFLLFNIGVIIFRVSNGYWGNSSIQVMASMIHIFVLYICFYELKDSD